MGIDENDHMFRQFVSDCAEFQSMLKTLDVF